MTTIDQEWLADAKSSAMRALAAIGQLWMTPENRTPRLAEASSLIERGLRKLEKESTKDTAIRKKP